MSERGSARWRRVDAIFAEALDKPPAERAHFLEEASGGDAELRRRVEELLSTAAAADDLFAIPGRTLQGGRVGAFRLLEEIGRGGMGRVYLAERADGQFQQRVALKLLRRSLFTEVDQRRFRLERQILARLQHPNIARLLDGGVTEEGQPYFVMEHVAGLPITEYCDRHRLGIPRRLQLFRTVCAAVQSAHSNLVVHRDLKAANILVDDDGQVKLLDFGIARVLDPEAFDQTTAITQTGVRLMTPDYAAPEQIRGGPITAATDVYALGVLLYELLTGRRPYTLTERSLREVERIVCEQAPLRPSLAAVSADATGGPPEERSGALRLSPEQLRRRLAGDLDTIILMALRKEPERRYGSAEQLAEDVRRHLERLPVQARAETLAYRAAKFARRHAIGLVASGFVALALVGGTLASAHQARVANLEREKAEHINSFLQDMLSAADPLRDGREVTVVEVLDRAAQEMDRTLEDRPEVEAGVRTTLGRTYERLGLYGQSEPHLRRALALQRARHPNGHPDVALALRDLAELLQAGGDYLAADSLYHQALVLQERRLGPSHAEVAVTLDRLGGLKQAQGDVDSAAAVLERALRMRRQLFGDLHADVGESLNNLGLLRYDQGDYAAADSLARQALALSRRFYGPEHVYVAFNLNNLARALQARGQHHAAERRFQESLALQRRLFGEEHPEVATTLDNLAQIHHDRRDLPGAEALYREALSLRRRLLGEDHPQVLSSLYNLALLLADRGDYVRAEPLYRELMARERRVLGEEHPDVTFTLHALGRLLHRTGRHSEADSLYTEALALDRRLLDYPHPRTAWHLASRAALLADMGRTGEADSLFREALTGLRAAFPAEHRTLLDAQLRWGQLLTELHRFDEAEVLLEESYRVARAQPGSDSESVQEALEALVELYTRWGRPDRAAAYRALQAS